MEESGGGDSKGEEGETKRGSGEGKLTKNSVPRSRIVETTKSSSIGSSNSSLGSSFMARISLFFRVRELYGSILSPPIHDSRTLFSNVIRLGFGAAHDSPSLRSEELQPAQQNQESSTNQVARSFANVTLTKKPAEMISTPSVKETGKKGKKQGRVLLSTTSVRRY